MLGVCLIGAGRIGRLHAANVAASADARLVRVVDADPQAAQAVAGRFGGAAGSDVAEALADPAVDAAFVCSPTDTHVDVVLAAAAAGKAVFCEKPVDLDIARVDACIAELARFAVPFMIGFHRRFDPTHRAVRDGVRAGRIGRIEQLQITSRDPGPPPPDYVRRSGGIFRDMMIHDLDQARFMLAEEFVSVHAIGAQLIGAGFEDLDDFDTATAMFWTASGVVCTIANSRRAVYGFDQRVELFGTNGVLAVDNRPRTTLAGFDGDGRRGDLLFDHFPERYAEAYRLELAHFVAALRDGVAPETGIDEARRSLVLANAADRSARERRPVQIEF